MKPLNYRLIVCMVALGVCVATLAHADPILDVVVDFDDDLLGGWANDAGGGAEDTSPTVETSGANKYLSFQFQTIFGLPTPQEDTLYNNSAGYSGDYSGVGAVSFSFMGYPEAIGQQLFFESTLGSIWNWKGDIGSTSHTWQNQSFTFGAAQWERDGGSAVESFAAALSVVKLVGITVSHINLGVGAVYEYGIDNWLYSSAVPEPGTVAMSATALLSMCTLFFRRRKRATPPSD